MLKLENVSKYYHNDGVVTLGLRKINLTFKSGEFIAITGESGSGKSTLLNVISGIDSYEDGELYINGEETSHYDENDWENYRRDSFAFIFQNYNLIDSFSVLKNVEVALVIQGLDKKSRIARAKEIIEKVGLTSHLKHRASKLSGGQKQRLAIARALAKDTQIIVADEPTGNLDSESGKQVLKLLSEVSKERLVIIVTHDYEQAQSYVTRKIRLFDGEVVEDKAINSVDYIEPKPKKVYNMSKINKIATISLFTILGQPKKTLLLLLVSFTSVFFVLLIYGSFLTIKPGADLGNNFSKFNKYEERLIVRRKDNLEMTQDDYDKILNLNQIASVIKEDLAVDLFISIPIYFRSNNYEELTGFLSFADIKPSDIIGKLPENDDEILISTYISKNDRKYLDEFLNSNILVSISMNNFNMSQSFKIVGFHIAKEDTTKYVIKDSKLDYLYQLLKINYMNYQLMMDSKSNPGQFFNQYYQLMGVDKTLVGNQISFLSYSNKSEYNIVKFAGIEVEIAEKNYENNFGPLYISQELFDQIKIPGDYQYTANLKNVKDADRVMDELYDLGYYSLSLYLNPQGYGYLSILIAVLTFISSGTIFFALFVVFLISYLIIKTILSSKKRDYTILRTIGFEKLAIKQLITFEIITYYMIAYVLFFIFYGIIITVYPLTQGLFFSFGEFIHKMLRSYGFTDILVVTFINLVISFLIARRFIKLLSKQSLFLSLRIGE